MKFCDLRCIYASLPKKEAIDGSGTCRTFVALYCSLKARHVEKNAICMNKEVKDMKIYNRGRDGTGPNGNGPRTGRGRGNCDKDTTRKPTRKGGKGRRRGQK